jgi:hypothetical protein
MIRIVHTLAGIALGSSLVACGGSSSAPSPLAASSTAISPSATPSSASAIPSPDASATPSISTKVVPPIEEFLNSRQAAWAKPRLVALPGVVGVLYQHRNGTLFVYVHASLTKKQRTRIQVLLAHATTH